MKLPKHLDLIYLDVAFITACYEQESGERVPTRITKGKDWNVGGSFFVTGGASMREQKEFQLDAHAMFESLEEKLRTFPTVDLIETQDALLPEMFWVNGVFGIAQYSHDLGRGERHSTAHFQFVPSVAQNKRTLNLITNDVYFSTGYDQLSGLGQSFACQFAIPARLLVRLLYCDRFYPVAAPLVVFKTGNQVGRP